MSKCVKCGMSGAFVRVDEDGLCILCRRKTEQSARGTIRLDPDAVLDRYLSTHHNTYPSGYDVRAYYTAEFETILSSLPKIPPKRRWADAESQDDTCIYLRKFTGCRLAECGDFVAVDTETSRLDRSAEIVQISAVKFKNFRPVSKFGEYCRPWEGISPAATAIHGITEDMVATAPRFAELIPALNTYFGDLPLVAHNAPFDMRMLASEGMDLSGKAVFDTLPLARSLIRDREGNKLPHYRLADCCRACAILFSGAHDATADALAAGLLFNELVRLFFGVTDLRQGSEQNGV